MSKFEELALEIQRKVERLLSPYGWEVRMKVVNRVRFGGSWTTAEFRFRFAVRREGHLLHGEQFGHSAELHEHDWARQDKRYFDELPRRWACDILTRTAGLMAERCEKEAWREVPVPPLAYPPEELVLLRPPEPVVKAGEDVGPDAVVGGGG